MFRPDPKPIKKPKSKPSSIRKVSKGMAKKLSEYSRLKKEFIKGKVCPVYPHLPCVDIHHMKGRTGDLLLDTFYWLPVSRKGHVKIETNPRWARDNEYSLPRNTCGRKVTLYPNPA